MDPACTAVLLQNFFVELHSALAEFLPHPSVTETDLLWLVKKPFFPPENRKRSCSNIMYCYELL
jgi:hypothetical protein